MTAPQAETLPDKPRNATGHSTASRLPSVLEGKPHRPSVFSPTVASAICQRISNGESLRSICRDADMPSLSTVMTWTGVKPAFSEQYHSAVAARAEHIFEEVMEIADDSANDMVQVEEGKWAANPSAVNRAKLQVDARKWYLSRLLPKKFGERTQVEHSGGLALTIVDQFDPAQIVDVTPSEPEE